MVNTPAPTDSACLRQLAAIALPNALMGPMNGDVLKFRHPLPRHLANTTNSSAVTANAFPAIVDVTAVLIVETRAMNTTAVSS